jgi:hypothetical protein
MSAADPAPANTGQASLPPSSPRLRRSVPGWSLAPFTEVDCDYFYGRDAEVRELTDRVRRAPLTVLYGVSGYGKSSLIGAGLIPMLRKAEHPIVLLRRCYDDLAARPLHGDVIAACASEIPGCTRPEAPETLTLWEFFHDRSQPWFRRAPSEEDADSADAAGFASWPGTKRPGQPPILPADVANRIVREAAGAAQDAPIEEIDAVPPILSLLCERLNDRPLAASRPQTSITAADFSAGEAERILGEFYDDKLRTHPNALRHFLEDKLVSDLGFRENVSLDSALASLRDSVPDADARLRRLVDHRVLVIEARGGSIPRVEFTHDTLAKLALDRRRERQEADRLLQEKRKALARKRRAMKWIAGSLAIAGISFGLMIWALKANRQAQQEKARALDLIRFMDVQVGEAFTKVPVQLRERVSDRLEAFYRSQGEPASFVDRQRRMGQHMRKALVHLEVVKRFEEGNFNEAVKKFYIEDARKNAMSELDEALRLGDILAGEAPGNREVTRDRILSQFHLATVSTQLGDSNAAAQHLNSARKMLDELVKAGPFQLVLYVDWMGLPNLDAAMGDQAGDAGDASTSRAWYDKALELQKELEKRRPNDPERREELKRIKERLEKPAPQE